VKSQVNEAYGSTITISVIHIT